MRRQLLRDRHSAETLAEMYATPHDHRKWGDHIVRVDHTIAAGLKLCGPGIDSAADLSCGNGAILDAMPATSKHYGDLAAGYRYTGPLDETLLQIPDVDLYICTETIEHLWEPEPILKTIAGKARLLLLSTPVDAWNEGNVEHYWAWDREAVEDMLTTAGFRVVDFISVPVSYNFGIWSCTT